MPDLTFSVVDAEPLPYAAAPTMLFKLRVENAVEGEQIHSIMLRTQIRLEVTRRQYTPETQSRLLELFGEPHRWSETLRSLLWTHASTMIPRFTGSIVAELPVNCTYDFEVTGTKYFHALEDGDVPLLFLFSGSIFYTADEGRMQITQIPWEKESPYRLPVQVWKDMMDRYFPNSAWLRLRQDVFDRLYSYKVERAIPTWEEAFDRLLRGAEAELEW